ncbi:MAG: leucyl aminopeptidase [Alphaproteobacteria bacterium]|nr:leucyl aminopeptidase [Alphaproteobacteria bacterium]
MLDIAFAKPVLPRSGALVLLVGEGELPTGLWEHANSATNGAISRAFDAAGFTGAKGKTCTILAPGAGLSRVVAVGLGKRDALTRRGLEEAGGHALAGLSRDGTASLAADGLSAEQAANVALGAVLRSYRFDRYRTKEKPEDKPKLTELAMLVDDNAAATAAFTPHEGVAKGVFLSRDLVSEPANILNPAEMARRCEALRELGIEVEVLGPGELQKLGFGALLGVSQGSVNEPRVVVMQWHGASGHGKKAKEKSLAFIGKGVTFDTGGISIKPAGGMEDMKWDMAGAGAVIGLMAALAGRKARADVVGLVGLVENMPSGTAQRPGDVVKSLSGQTIEVINTDAEGRLVLADVMWYCQQRFDPAFMVDLATLTGAIIIGLGHEHAGLFSNDDALANKLLAAGLDSGEKLWRMPLNDEYDKQIKSDIADMKNVGGRPGGSITAAQFLQRFVNGKPWAHLDIAGMAWSSKDAPTRPKGATAFGVRLLDRLVAEHHEG